MKSLYRYHQTPSDRQKWKVGLVVLVYEVARVSEIECKVKPGPNCPERVHTSKQWRSWQS